VTAPRGHAWDRGGRCSFRTRRWRTPETACSAGMWCGPKVSPQPPGTKTDAATRRSARSAQRLPGASAAKWKRVEHARRGQHGAETRPSPGTRAGAEQKHGRPGVSRVPAPPPSATWGAPTCPGSASVPAQSEPDVAARRAAHGEPGPAPEVRPRRGLTGLAEPSQVKGRPEPRSRTWGLRAQSSSSFAVRFGHAAALVVGLAAETNAPEHGR